MPTPSAIRARRAQFQDLMYQSMLQPGTASGQQTVVPAGLQLGLGTRSRFQRDRLHPGQPSTETDNPLDLVIQGSGFFQMQQPSGQLAYTRCGPFQLDKDGNVVTSDGNLLQPQITIPPTAQQITIAQRRHGQLHPAEPDRGAAGRPDPAGQFSESGRAEQHGQQSATRPPTLPAMPDRGLRAARKAWARCCRDTSSNPTFQWWTSSST